MKNGNVNELFYFFENKFESQQICHYSRSTKNTMKCHGVKKDENQRSKHDQNAIKHRVFI